MPRAAASLPFAMMIPTLKPASVPARALRGVDHVVVQTSDIDASKNFYGTQLGIRLALEQSRPDWGGDMLFPHEPYEH